MDSVNLECGCPRNAGKHYYSCLETQLIRLKEANKLLQGELKHCAQFSGLKYRVADTLWRAKQIMEGLTEAGEK